MTQELTHLLADRLAGYTAMRELDHGCVLGWSCPCGTTRSTGGSPWASSPSGSSPYPHTTTTRVYNNMGTIYPLVTMFTHGRYLREGDAVRGHAGYQGEEDAAAELRRGGHAVLLLMLLLMLLLLMLLILLLFSRWSSMRSSASGCRRATWTACPAWSASAPGDPARGGEGVRVNLMIFKNPHQ